LLGASEPFVQQLLAERLARGSVFVDVGASVGFFTLIAARLIGATGHVYAVEPQPRAAAVLRRNVASNHLENVTVLELAAGDHRGFSNIASGDHLTARLSEVGHVVRVLPIDELDLPSATLIKIDVEGAETSVLAGMQRLLTLRRPSIVCEIHGDTRAECERLLTTASYSVRMLEESGGGMPHLLAEPA
jgi:FkbM family methyltransferase